MLAAIGQIESGDGANTGPSSAGALGPMQFLPSTWRIWGIDGVRRDRAAGHHEPVRRGAVRRPAAVRHGAAQGGQGLRQAIFAYNHATWYVNEVLTLAAEYARESGLKEQHRGRAPAAGPRAAAARPGRAARWRCRTRPRTRTPSAPRTRRG